MRKYLKFLWALYRDPRTPGLSKLLPWIALLYLLLPFDVIPDFLPLLGQVDDIVAIVTLLSIALGGISKSVYDEHRRKISGARHFLSH